MSRRGRRDGQRGHVAIVVAVSGVTLLAATGLALDGGMEAGAYRHAQNAADAGALAAARQEYVNAMATPSVLSDTASLTPMARTEVEHNSAHLASINAATSALTTWLPNGGGLSGQAALAEISGPGGTLLSPLDASMELNGTTASALDQSVSSAGSQIDLAGSSVAGTTMYTNCWTASATYHAGTDTYGTPAACAMGSGTLAAGLSIAGTPLGGGGTNAKVDRNDAPSAAPRMLGVNVGGGITSPFPNAQGTTVSVSSATSSSGSSLEWNPVTGLTATAEVSATGVHAVAPGVTVDATNLYMGITAWVDPTTGTPNLQATCTPTTLTFTKTGGVQALVAVDSSCAAATSNLSALNISATVTVPWEQPSPLDGTQACSTDSVSRQVNCSGQACLVRITVETELYPSTLCLGETNISFVAKPTTMQPFTGKVTVSATMAQPTYFLRVLGWSQTNPTASATAGVEPVIDESQAAFAASPFGMPDMGTTMTGTITFERLKPGDTYYLYGPNMQSYNPAPSWSSSWQGQLDAASPHRVGNTLLPVSGLTTSPQPYLSNGPYYLEPVFDPVSGVVEYYGVFLPVAGQPHWGTLVNSIPALHGYIVQATTSNQSWVVLEEGAVSVKLAQ
jgi:hypothetical protein